MMKKKKLIIFIPTIEDGGVEKNLFIISNYLKDKLNLSLITINEKFKNRFSKKIKFISFKNNTCQDLSRYIKFLICLLFLFKELIADKNTVVMSFQGNIYCAILCKLMGIKIIIRSNSSPDGWSQNIFKHLCFKIIFNFVDKIVVNSIDFKNQFKFKFNLDAVCIYNPLNKKEIIEKSKIKSRIRFDKKKLNLINVGRLVDQKDQITILKSLNELKKKINFNLIIVGKGEKKKFLLNYIKENKLSKFVKMIDYQKSPFNLIRQSDIFLLTSKYEGLPNVLLEAQVLKTYIISSNCPTGPKEILINGKAGSLFKVGDFNGLSKLIIDYSKKKEKYYKKIQIGFNHLHRFDYKSNLKSYLNLVNSLM